jgi:hypothetical protein
MKIEEVRHTPYQWARRIAVLLRDTKMREQEVSEARDSPDLYTQFTIYLACHG